MNPHTHFLFPFFLSAILVKLGILNWKLAIMCGFIGMFVDIDHYIEHIVHSKTNRFSLVSTWTNSIKSHRFIQRSFIHDLTGGNNNNNIIYYFGFLLLKNYFNLNDRLLLSFIFRSYLGKQAALSKV